MHFDQALGLDELISPCLNRVRHSKRDVNYATGICFAKQTGRGLQRDRRTAGTLPQSFQRHDTTNRRGRLPSPASGGKCRYAASVGTTGKPSGRTAIPWVFQASDERFCQYPRPVVTVLLEPCLRGAPFFKKNRKKSE